MDPIELAKDLWSLANAITAFAIAQGVAFALALGGNFGQLQNAEPVVKKGIIAVIVIFTAAYSAGIYGCYALTLLLQSDPANVCWYVTFGRIIAIWLFSILDIVGLLAIDLTELATPKKA